MAVSAVRLNDLTPAQRRLVQALIAAREAADARRSEAKKAA